MSLLDFDIEGILCGSILEELGENEGDWGW